MQHYNQDAVYGTWYPTGYHGHFRSKSRLEFTIPYRERAKPPPPTKFLDRSCVRSTDHLFSRHDNRNAHATHMGDLETYFSHGLGKRKSQSGAVQRYKDTSRLLSWTPESSINQLSSYRASFSSTPPWQHQQRLVNEAEPVHSRSNLNLYRRQRRPMTGMQTERTAPLLAWNEPDDATYQKPCIGNQRNKSAPARILSRPETASVAMTLQTFENNDNSKNNIVETVTRLDL